MHVHLHVGLYFIVHGCGLVEPSSSVDIALEVYIGGVVVLELLSSPKLIQHDHLVLSHLRSDI